LDDRGIWIPFHPHPQDNIADLNEITISNRSGGYLFIVDEGPIAAVKILDLKTAIAKVDDCVPA
jgi:hypothetical protein